MKISKSGMIESSDFSFKNSQVNCRTFSRNLSSMLPSTIIFENSFLVNNCNSSISDGSPIKVADLNLSIDKIGDRAIKKIVFT
uniref:Uncharacterized protein n=1 Tax=Romanomermis culicivorax TaxID=13658 RepID=A0A915L3G9_ROMCU